MKFKVTALGGATKDIAQIVEAIVAYLQPGAPPNPPPPSGPADPASEPAGPAHYYADRGEEPGRWRGRAAHTAGLAGAVSRHDFAQVLAGRDPHTGERLITAQGSAGRRPRLGVGNHTRVAPDGTPLYSEADAAAVLGLTHTELAHLLDVGAAPATNPDPSAAPGPLPDSLPGFGSSPGQGPARRTRETRGDRDQPGPASSPTVTPPAPGSVPGSLPGSLPGFGSGPGQSPAWSTREPGGDRDVPGPASVPSPSRPAPDSVPDPADVTGTFGSGTARPVENGIPSLPTDSSSGESVPAVGANKPRPALGDTPVGPAAGAEPPGSYLVPVRDENGSRWVTEAELARCLAARDKGTDPATVAAAGTSTDTFPLSEAARLAGVTARYLRGRAKEYADNQREFDTAIAAGRQPDRAYLIAERDPAGRWRVSRQELVAYLQRRRAVNVRVGFDVTLTTEKSLGVLALLGEPDATRAVLSAIEGGNDWALDWLEARATARVKGKTVPAAGGWMSASFRHLTSRALDPFPHHHNVIANTVTIADGSRRALDGRGLYRDVHAASALATAEMRHQLAGFGVRWRPAHHGGWEIAGIPDAVLHEFSMRRNEIDDALDVLREAIGTGIHPADIDEIVLATRPAKQHTAVTQLLAEWHRRANAHGFTGTDLAACHNHQEPVPDPDPDALFASLAQPDGICAGLSVFSRGDALGAMANHPNPIAEPDEADEAEARQPLLCGAARLEALTDQFLTSPHVVALAAGTDRDEALYTTREILAVQDRIVARFRKGRHHGAALVPAHHLQATLGRFGHLSDEQRQLVTGWCTSGHRFQTAIGRAGAGKTTTVAAAARAWEAAGYRVRGAAVKGEAARTLAAAAGIKTETVAWYLAQADSKRPPIDEHTVLVIDEASTLSDRDLDTLMTMAADTGATLRLIGDPAQHSAVTPGGMYRVLCERHPRDTPELATTFRLQHPADRAATEALRAGNAQTALDHLAQAGHLHIVDHELDLHRQVLARWWTTHLAGHDHPMVDRRNTTRQQLNRLAHQLRQVHGEIGTDEILASNNRGFSIGDRISARIPARGLHPPGNRRAYVRNGALGTITAISHHHNADKETITVAFDDIGTITIPRGFFDHHRTPAGRIEAGIDHAYALTSYAVQGATNPESTSRIDPTANRSEAYVDITRGQHANHLYLTNPTDPLDGETLPKLPAPPPAQAVAERLRASNGEVTAWEIAHPPATQSSVPAHVLGR
jgi:conjugative relaxase-like TrwC/TraI family protein